MDFRQSSVCQAALRNPVPVLMWHTSFHKSVSPNIATFNKKHLIHTRVKLWQSSQHLPHLSATLVHQSTVKPHCYDIALYGTFILTIKSLLQFCFVQNISSRKCFDIFLKINNILNYLLQYSEYYGDRNYLNHFSFPWPPSLLSSEEGQVPLSYK